MPHPFQHPAQRRCPNSPCKQAQTQPLQSSSAALTTHNQPSNDTISHRKHQPGKGMLDGSASAGGELILGRRESELFFKSPLSERQQAASSDFLKTLLADFRRPRSQPPTKPQTSQHPLPRRPFIRSPLHPFAPPHPNKKRHHVTKKRSASLIFKLLRKKHQAEA